MVRRCSEGEKPRSRRPQTGPEADRAGGDEQQRQRPRQQIEVRLHVGSRRVGRRRARDAGRVRGHSQPHSRPAPATCGPTHGRPDLSWRRPKRRLPSSPRTAVVKTGHNIKLQRVRYAPYLTRLTLTMAWACGTSRDHFVTTMTRCLARARNAWLLSWPCDGYIRDRK